MTKRTESQPQWKCWENLDNGSYMFVLEDSGDRLTYDRNATRRGSRINCRTSINLSRDSESLATFAMFSSRYSPEFGDRVNYEKMINLGRRHLNSPGLDGSQRDALSTLLDAAEEAVPAERSD